VKQRFAVLVRPWLGFGGADRWAIDAALALQDAGWRVEIWVNDCKGRDTIPELLEGRVTVRTPALAPASRFNRFRLWRTIGRQHWLLKVLKSAGVEPDLLICDSVVQAAVRMRRDWPRSRILIYCHFPDALFPVPWNPLHQLYRRFGAWWEKRGMDAADRVLVNSSYTGQAVVRAFPSWQGRAVSVVHPGTRIVPRVPGPGAGQPKVFLVVGRFDPSKNLPLALAAFAGLKTAMSEREFAQCRLVLAGGFDERRPEVVAVVADLKSRALQLGVAEQLTFAFNVRQETLQQYWVEAFALVHPALEEHFGIVLIEAMMRGLPVLAVDAAGPREIVVDGVTGALRSPKPEAFGAVMRDWVREPARVELMRDAARARAIERFSMERFAREFVHEAEQALLAK